MPGETVATLARKIGEVSTSGPGPGAGLDPVDDGRRVGGGCASAGPGPVHHRRLLATAAVVSATARRTWTAHLLRSLSRSARVRRRWSSSSAILVASAVIASPSPPAPARSAASTCPAPSGRPVSSGCAVPLPSCSFTGASLAGRELGIDHVIVPAAAAVSAAAWSRARLPRWRGTRRSGSDRAAAARRSGWAVQRRVFLERLPGVGGQVSRRAFWCTGTESPLRPAGARPGRPRCRAICGRPVSSRSRRSSSAARRRRSSAPPRTLVRLEVSLMVIRCSVPVSLPGRDVQIPFASMSKVTSICGTPRTGRISPAGTARQVSGRSRSLQDRRPPRGWLSRPC